MIERSSSADVTASTLGIYFTELLELSSVGRLRWNHANYRDCEVWNCPVGLCLVTVQRGKEVPFSGLQLTIQGVNSRLEQRLLPGEACAALLEGLRSFDTREVGQDEYEQNIRRTLEELDFSLKVIKRA